MPFSIKLDNGSRELAGVSRNATKKMKAVTVDWLDDFASSEAVTFKFHSGNEPQWSVKMAGSRDAEKSFRSCVQQPRRGEHSSPCRRARRAVVGSAPATRPFRGIGPSTIANLSGTAVRNREPPIRRLFPKNENDLTSTR